MFTSFLFKTAPAVALSLACAGLLSAATVSPQTTFTGNITLTSAQYDNYFVYSANGGTFSGAQGVGITNPFSGQTHYVPGGTFPISESLPEYISSGVATAMGLYSSSGVSIAVNQSLYSAALGTETWDQVFTGTPESTIVAALASDNVPVLEGFLNQYASDFVSFSSNTSTPITAGILHFSTAADGGLLTFSNIAAVGAPPPAPVSAAPEPSTDFLLAGGLMIIGFAGRKLRKA